MASGFGAKLGFWINEFEVRHNAISQVKILSGIKVWGEFHMLFFIWCEFSRNIGFGLLCMIYLYYLLMNFR